MYGIAATKFGYLLVAPAFQEGLYTPERHLFYLAMETFIYKYKISIGMLNAHAEPFYPSTDNNQQKDDIKKEATDNVINYENKTDIKDNNTSPIKTPLSTKENITIQEANKFIEEDWVQVKRNTRTRVVRDAIQEAYIKNVKNHYAVLVAAEEVVDEKDTEKNVPESKKAAVEKHITDDVNEITVDTMLQYINEYKEKDDAANAYKEKMNEEKNSSTCYTISNDPSFETKEEKEENILMDSDSESNEDNDDEDSSIDDNDLTSDNVDSFDSFTIEDLEEEEQLYVKRLKEAVEGNENVEDSNEDEMKWLKIKLHLSEKREKTMLEEYDKLQCQMLEAEKRLSLKTQELEKALKQTRSIISGIKDKTVTYTD